MREYEITVPIAGHAIVTVLAENEQEARDAAFDQITNDSIESWEPLEAFNTGNVCHCPYPWEMDVIDNGPVEEQEDEA